MSQEELLSLMNDLDSGEMMKAPLRKFRWDDEDPRAARSRHGRPVYNGRKGAGFVRW